MSENAKVTSNLASLILNTPQERSKSTVRVGASKGGQGSLGTLLRRLSKGL
jgi:hypothetical protein